MSRTPSHSRIVVAVPTKKMDALVAVPEGAVGCCLVALAGGREAAGEWGWLWVWVWEDGRERIGERDLEGSRTRCGRVAMVELLWRFEFEDGFGVCGISLRRVRWVLEKSGI
jgi:hypothetical protein